MIVNIKYMDKETVVETIIEIADRGQFAKEAMLLLINELESFGYSKNEIYIILKTAIKGSKQYNKRRYANNLYGIIKDKINAKSHIKSHNHFYATLVLLGTTDI